MPDMKPSALWFLDNILSPKLTSLAEKKKIDITSYHSEILALHSSEAPSGSKRASKGAPIPNCQGCNGPLRGSVFTPCAAMKCKLILHKKCAPVTEHKCVTELPVTSTVHASVSSSQSVGHSLNQPGLTFSTITNPLLSILPPSSTLPGASVPPSLAGASAAPEPVSGAGAALQHLSRADAAPTASQGQAPPESAAGAVPVSDSRKRRSGDISLFDSDDESAPSFTPSIQFTSAPSITISSSPPTMSVPHVKSTVSVRPKTKPPGKRARASPATTPEGVQVEYLTHEVSMAQAKIASLDAALRDRDDTIQIMSQRIKSLEDPMFSNLRSQYLSTTPPCVPGNPAATAPLPAADMGQVLSEIATLRTQVVSLQVCVTQLVNHSSATFPPAPTVTAPPAPTVTAPPAPTVTAPPAPTVTAPPASAVKAPALQSLLSVNTENTALSNPGRRKPATARPHLLPRPHQINPWISHTPPYPAPHHAASSYSSGSSARQPWITALSPPSSSLPQYHNTLQFPVPPPPSHKPAYRPKTNPQSSTTPRPSTVSRQKHKASQPAHLVKKQHRQPGGVLGGAPPPSAASRLELCARRVTWAAARSLHPAPAPSNVPPVHNDPAQAAGPQPPLQVPCPLPPPGTLSQLGPQLEAIPNVPTDNRYAVLSELAGN